MVENQERMAQVLFGAKLLEEEMLVCFLRKRFAFHPGACIKHFLQEFKRMARYRWRQSPGSESRV